MAEVIELFTTNVGSHIWSMNHPGSDIDLYVCYLAPSTDFLLGKTHWHSHQSITGEIDRSSHELGVVVNEVLKGNFNHLIGVMSPIVIKGWPGYHELRRLTKLNFSRQCYHSINGLGVHNYKKYIESGKDTSPKRCNLIARVLKMGIYLLKNGELEFLPVSDIKPSDIPQLLDELKHAREVSILPEKPEHVQEIMDWLLNIRVCELKKELPNGVLGVK